MFSSFFREDPRHCQNLIFVSRLVCETKKKRTKFRCFKALQDVTEANAHWNRSLAVRYIETHQDPDGAFTDPGLTADVVLALSQRSLGWIRNLDCDKSDSEIDNSGWERALSVRENATNVVFVLFFF